MVSQKLSAQQTEAVTLPVFAKSVKTLRRALSNSEINWKSISQIILVDPGLVLQTLRLLKSDTKGSKGHGLFGLSQALMLMGTNKVNRLVLGLPVIERSLRPSSQTGYLQTVNRAYHAAFQARNWAQWRNDIAPEEIYVTTLLYCVPELFLWATAPEKIQLLRRSIYKYGVAPHDAELSVLGSPLREYWDEYSTTVQLPSLMTDVLDPKKADLPRVQAVLLANRLANAVEFGWYSDSVADIIDQVAQHLCKHPDQATRIIHKNAVNIAHENPFAEILNKAIRPAAVLLGLIPGDDDLLVREHFPDPETKSQGIDNMRKSNASSSGVSLVHSNTTENVEPGGITVTSTGISERTTGSLQINQSPAVKDYPASTKAEKDPVTGTDACLQPQPALFAKAVQQLQSDKLVIEDEIIRVTLEGMRDGAGFHRMVYASLSDNRYYLETRQIIGTEYDPTFKLFKVKLTGHDLFSRLLERPSSIWINDENRAKYLQAIPRDLKVIIKTNSFCVMSMHLNDQAAGIFYVDKYSPNCAIDKQSFALFRHLGQLATKRLSHILSPKK